MITFNDVLVASKGHPEAMINLYRECRYYNGRDMVKVFHTTIVRGNAKDLIEQDDIACFFTMRLWRAVDKWSSDLNNLKKVDFEDAFRNYIWQGVLSSFYDHIYEIFGTKLKDSKNKATKINISLALYQVTDFTRVADEYSLDPYNRIEAIDQYNKVMEVLEKIKNKKSERYIRVVKAVMCGKSCKLISKQLRVSTTTVYSIMKSCTELWNRLNQGEPDVQKQIRKYAH